MSHPVNDEILERLHEEVKSEALYKNAPDTVIEYVVMKRFEDLSNWPRVSH